MTKTKPYKDITLEFDEGKHRFFANGNPVPSVTGFTGVVDKSRQLMWWQERLTREYLIDTIRKGQEITEGHVLAATRLHREKKKAAATIGNTVHKWAEEFVKTGKKPPIPKIEEVENGILAFLKWLDESGMKIKKAERHIYSKKYKYAGIVDAEGTYKPKIKDRRLVLIDYKTSSGIYPEMLYQTAGYQNALQEMTGNKYDERWIIRFDKETGEFHPYLCGSFEKDFAAFLGCRAIKLRSKEIGKING